VGPKSDPHAIDVGADGSLWVTLGTPRKIARIDPSTGAATPFDVPSADGGLNDVAVAPDGTLWVSQDAPVLLHLRTDGSLIARYRLPAGAQDADGIAIAPNGRVWAAAPDGNMIVAVTPGS
jgi:streptogramin lyase